MTQNQIITVAARKKMLRARAGEIQLPKIMGFVFGDGGVNASGEVISPLESESKLKHEILRKAYDKKTQISEIGLYDKDGDILVIKRFSKKGKDADLSMTFWINDTF